MQPDIEEFLLYLAAERGLSDHKGGPRQGVFLQIISEAKNDIQVPGRDFTFGELIASQAAGDAKVLGGLGRPVLTLTLADAKAGIAVIKNAI
jgi:glucose-6-phosphate isomerase